MTSIEEHEHAADELIRDIEEKVRFHLLARRQRIVGLAASEAAVNLFAALLHKRNLIGPGTNINHRAFKSMKMAREQYGLGLPHGDELLMFLVAQEDFRDKLCYGKAKDESVVQEAVRNLFELKRLIESIQEGSE